jgi:hypothetical protein
MSGRLERNWRHHMSDAELDRERVVRRATLTLYERHLGPWEPTDRADDVLYDIRMLDRETTIQIEDVVDYLHAKAAQPPSRERTIKQSSATR